MHQSFRVLAAALVLLPVLAADARGRQLLEVDGIELRGQAELVMSGGGRCNVLESDTRYEEKKANHGAPMDIWRLEFAVRNGTARWLDHLIARYEIDAEWPECTNWDEPEAGHPLSSPGWARESGFIQRSGRNVVAPGQTLTETVHIIVLRGDPKPRFVNWSLDFDFGAAARPGDPGAPAAAQPPAATAEQENLFWQSIAESTNPAEFEAYLIQFPDGVFRPLATARLAALRERSDAPVRTDRVPQGKVESPQQVPTEVAFEARCGESNSQPHNCWVEVPGRGGCYAWFPGKGGTSDFFPPYSGARFTSFVWEGQCLNGLAHGDWVLTRDSETVQGPFVEGKRHGYWESRKTSEDTEFAYDNREGEFVNGRLHGTLRVLRLWFGEAQKSETRFVNGERVD